ncbi:unnamed protein product [Prorocentrum cordatum]|uniref:Autophagy-related protein 101 n=1 Tax=Prorocentrum cordatum TaxID=2364126 RepID=A0ABN9QU98_9DINO|nr:unnamed protein product [Polarella glacialis]
MAQVLVHMVHQFLREVLEVTELLACQVRGIDDGLVSVEHRPLGRHRRPVLVRGVSRQGPAPSVSSLERAADTRERGRRHTRCWQADARRPSSRTAAATIA